MKAVLLQLAIWILGTAPCALQAQRAFSVQATANGQGGISLKWPVRAATPSGDLRIVPIYRVERSTNLADWTQISGDLTGPVGGSVSFSTNSGDIGFYRVLSIVDRPYAFLDHARLASAQLASANFFGAQMFNVVLTNADLTDANLSGAFLLSSDLTGANATGANFLGIEAFNTVFDQTILAGVDGRYGDFGEASFSQADLTGADFRSAILANATFDLALFFGTKMDSNTIVDAKPKLIWQWVNQGPPNRILTNQDLSFSALTNADFRGVDVSGATLDGSDLRGADARGANFRNASLNFVDLRGMILDDSTSLDPTNRLIWQIGTQGGAQLDLQGARIAAAFLPGVDLHGANLSTADCSQSLFPGANFAGANLSHGRFTGVDFLGATLTNANMTLGVFNQADFTNANLRNAVTNGASFAGAIFSNTIMPNGTIRNR